MTELGTGKGMEWTDLLRVSRKSTVKVDLQEDLRKTDTIRGEGT